MPAVVDFSRHQADLDRLSKSGDEVLSSCDNVRQDLWFKGEPLITPQQLREQLEVRISAVTDAHHDPEF